MTVEIFPAEYIQLDSFPTTVTATVNGEETKFPGNEYRTIVTDNRLYVLEDSPEGPTAVVNEPLETFSGDYKAGFTAVTDSGTYLIVREANCGCGSRLRGYHPFLMVPHQARISNGA